MKHLLPTIAVTAILTATAFGGPPLICSKIEIGGEKSLPWKQVEGWDGVDPAYEVTRLTTDTLAILSPQASIPLRMETMRRASVYAAKDMRLATEIAARLTARVLDAEASGKRDPLAWFDAGYWIESVRQASFIYKYDMLSKNDRQTWQIRSGLPGMDGYPWVQRAIQLGGKGMGHALSLMGEYRNADTKAQSE